MDKQDIQSWNGEGLPPVGTVCEYSLNGGELWWGCRIEYVVGTQGVVMSCDVAEGVQFVPAQNRTTKFRPILTPEQIEAERRFRIVSKIYNLWPVIDRPLEYVCYDIYDAIRAGKIEGVKIDG